MATTTVKAKTTPKDKVVKDKKDEMPEKETPETPDAPLPLLDLSDAAVRKMIRLAKKRGYVTHDQINAVLPSEEVTSDQIEDVFAMLNEMGINVVEQEETDPEESGDEPREEAEEDEGEGELIEVVRATPAKAERAEPGERTDDPVRMYLREMGSVELLSREGEIAIAKRIEAGREAMIAGLCESPLTFQAIIIWRDELNLGKVFLRDIIDLEATYAGPEAKGVGVPGVPAFRRSRRARPGWGGRCARRSQSRRRSGQMETVRPSARRRLPPLRPLSSLRRRRLRRRPARFSRTTPRARTRTPTARSARATSTRTISTARCRSRRSRPS